MAIYTIEGGMAEALSHLKRIAEHFTEHGELSTANELGKLSIGIVSAFSKGVDHIPSAEYELEVSTARHGRTPMARAVGNNTLQQQAAAALMNEVERKNESVVAGATGANRLISTVQRVPIRPAQHSHSGSWAQVAVSNHHPYPRAEPRAAAQCVPTLGMPTYPLQISSGSEDDSSSQITETPGTVQDGEEALIEAKAGVIRIHGKVAKDFIQFITTRIHEGPLQDIHFEGRGCVKVTFLHISQALAFLKSNQDMERMLGFGRFGGGYHVELVEVIDWNDDHRRMNQPIRERRRLSFARKRLFADNMSPEKWKQDIRALAGLGNIDFLWVFNSGNATAVFTSTVIAREVLETYNKWKTGRNVYTDVSVTYSSDPCEKELVLVRESHRPSGRNPARRVMR